MRVLITGGGGFVGRNLAHLLPQYGHTTLAPTRQELDMTNEEQYIAYINRTCPDAVIHTAFKGHFGNQGDVAAFTDNLKMYETLGAGDRDDFPTIIFGSGAEFDRRCPVVNVHESDVFDCWPIDLYGLSKNIITRRFIGMNPTSDMDISNPFLLRLFGCFGSDEPDYRFIKRSILRLKQGLPIEIAKDKVMDFFYIEDVAAVTHRVLVEQSNQARHVNLVYEKKYLLSDIAKIICKVMKVPENIQILDSNMDWPYSGDWTRLQSLNYDMYGFEQGIARMVHDLSLE